MSQNHHQFWKTIGCQWRERERERERDGIEKNQYKVIKVDKEKKNETSISNR